MDNMPLIINVEGLNKHFGSIHAVKNLSLKVKRGEIFGFLGPNGSGKTTTIRMLCGLLTPDSGKGYCLNHDILSQSNEIKKHVGYMTQRFSFYEDLTIYENLDFVARLYQLKDRKQQIEVALQNSELANKREQLAGTLSGGWKQRLALAACLLHKPDLLLLDEPTAGVDPQARRKFWDQIHALSQQGITTLVSTHYMDEAERCTRLAYIDLGELLVEGTIKEIINIVGLNTWSIKGKNLAVLAKELKVLKGIDQVVVFGETLHISSHDKIALEAAIAPYKVNENYHFQKVESSIEDVFISLVEKQSHE